MTQSDIAPSAAAIAAIQRGHKIEAIKLVREEHGLGLKEAKDLVDRYEKAHPRQRTHQESGQVPPRSGLGWLWVGVLIGVAIAWFYWSGQA